MIRFLALLILIAVACRWIFGKWPWEDLHAKPARQMAISKARKLLGVSPDADSHAIREAHRRRTAMIHPDRGGSNAAMQELNAARDLLLSDTIHEKPERPE